MLLKLKVIQLEARDVEYFQSVLSARNVIYDPSEDPATSNLTQYNVDFFNLHRGAST